MAWLGWLVAAFIWVMCALYFVVLYTSSSPRISEDAWPRAVGWLVDAVALFMLVHADWYVTATVYALSVLVLECIGRRRAKSSSCNR